MIASVATATMGFLFQEKALTDGALNAALIIRGLAKVPAENKAPGWHNDTVANPITLSPKEGIRSAPCQSAREIKADSTAGTRDNPIKYVCRGPNNSRPHGKA